MDLILLYRMVILDIIIMLTLLVYGLYCKKYDESSKKFIPFAIICFTYSIFGLITEITVNSNTIPTKVNDICHVFYFTFGLLFSFNYLKYVLEMVVSEKILKRILWGAGIISAICIITMLFSDITYVQGAGTRYSQGLGPTLCYALGFLFIIISDAIIVANRKNIEDSVLFALLPLTFVAIVLLVIQIVYPMFLFSESAIVLICLGAFFAIENPVGRFKKSAELYYDYAYKDGLTGLFNRRAYGEELANYKESIPDDIVCVAMDLNGLKVVNDNVGHEAGDELIAEAGRLITEAFSKYGKVFRTGGDEFCVVARMSRENCEEAVAYLNKICDAWVGSFSDQMKISVGAGYKSDVNGEDIMKIAYVADQRMYEAKDEYYSAKGIDRRGQVAAHNALCNLYTKIIKINLTKDTYSIINMDIKEQTTEKGFTDNISTWLSEFGKTGHVHSDDLEEYLEKTDLEYLKNYFLEGKTSISIFYRRKYEDGFKQVAMEMIPADDYAANNQTLFLYVKDIDI